MQYNQFKVVIRDQKYVQLSRQITFEDLYDTLKGAIDRDLLKPGQKVHVWIKGSVQESIVMFTPPASNI